MSTRTLGFIIIALGIIGGTVAVFPRGIRNNNPGNIRISGDAWRGLSKAQGDGVFFRFDDVVYGIRAMARIITNYQSRGILTVEQIISTWAPSNENDTTAYINSVYKATGWPRGWIPAKNEGDYVALIKAIIKHENGLNPYSDATIARGIELA